MFVFIKNGWTENFSQTEVPYLTNSQQFDPDSNRTITYNFESNRTHPPYDQSNCSRNKLVRFTISDRLIPEFLDSNTT